ncbi:uncharacterized protein LOC134798932 [Cydia splendana]|uniref:uncharacterized protein LOC134798932 n=1 Tax=Cydia splendana TaxID=1100963 RepID=UPI00300D71B0
MPPKIRAFKCEICGNLYTRDVPEKRKFMEKFPLDEDRCKQWVKLIGNEDLVYLPIEKLHELKFVCADHFEKKLLIKKTINLKRLPSAIPSKNLKADPLPDEMLLNFPCHVYSKRNIPTNLDPLAIGDNEVYSLPQVEAIAGPSNSDSFMPGQQLPSQAMPLQKLEAIPITDETQLNFSNNAYSNIVDKRNDNEVSLPQVEAIAGPSNSGVSQEQWHRASNHCSWLRCSERGRRTREQDRDAGCKMRA